MVRRLLARYEAPVLARQMRKDWDQRARENARHFVATSQHEWTDEDFFESGRIWISYHIVPYLDLLSAGLKPSEMRVLEIGCGAGRMTMGLSEIFGWIDAVDVSPEMIAVARNSLAHCSNVGFQVNNGIDLKLFSGEQFDLVFSAIVFQHIPSKVIIGNYIREAYRVLRPGSFFKFQLQGRSILPEDTSTWVGVGFTEKELTAAAKAAGFRVHCMTGAGTQEFWITLQKA
jgi:SAM-dependent methyltransferase